MKPWRLDKPFPSGVNMRQLVYFSRVQKPFDHEQLKHILDKSRLNNHQYYVTGVLLTDDSQFLHALEGEENQVSVIFSRINKDPRHFDIKILGYREVAQREFGNWAMAANDDSETNFGGRVEALVGGITCESIKAKFSNFADYADNFSSSASPRRCA